jgi:hypothetical protein
VPDAIPFRQDREHAASLALRAAGVALPPSVQPLTRD